MSQVDIDNIPDSESINAQVQQLAEWLAANPRINGCARIENLQFFLRTCKFDLGRTKKKLEVFYRMRAECPQWFADRDPFRPEIQELLTLGPFLPVDGVDREQRKVVIVRTSVHSPKLHNQNDVFKVSKMVLDLLLHLEPDSCARGIVAIFDMNAVQLGHALQLTPTLIKRSVESWTAYPCQPKLLEFINAPRHVNFLLNTFRLFMTTKMRSRVFVRGRNETSVQCVELPANIGGSGITYDALTQKWKALVEQHADFYAELDKYKSIL